MWSIVSAPPLLHAIGRRLAMVGAGLIAIMIGLTILEYAGDVGKLRRSTLERQTETLFDALRSGQTSQFHKLCEEHPEVYAYRVFDDTNTVTAEVNGHLLSAMPLDRGGRPDISFTHTFATSYASDQWLVTRSDDVNGRRLWLTVAMTGDPGMLWRDVILDKVLSHVVLPVLVIAPTLGLAILIALRSTLRPLSRIATRARVLTENIDSGETLQKLSPDDLPREALDLVSAINALLQKLEAILAQQRQFAENAAHELRTPLAALKLQIFRLLPSSPALEKAKLDISVMARLVDQLLRLAQAQQLAKAGFISRDLREIARAACEEMALAAVGQDRMLEFDEPQSPVLVLCNAEFIQIAIRNIIENALRAAPVGSTVVVAVSERGEVSVSDRGPGIADAEKPLVFQRFWTNRRRNGTGAGIGLALVAQIVELHGGTTRIEDREGGGARITLSFSLARTLPAPPQRQSRHPQSNGLSDRRLVSEA